jgi:DNA (cytosine-5)-methyltransferase 1
MKDGRGEMQIKKQGRISAISLFSGCGGMDLGFEKEGFEILWAIDTEYYACRTYRDHFGERIVNRDIIEIDFSTVPDCDVILGGFPCQDFSVIWNRPGIHGKRGDLYRHFVRAVIAKRPKAFVAENVKGLISANKGRAYSQIVSDFMKAGYRIYAHVYNFAEYGVPQHRERLIILGLRNDIGSVFTKPEPTHGTSLRLPYVTAKEALKGIEKVKHNNEKMKTSDKIAKMLELIPPGGNFSDVPKSSPYYVKGMISHVYRRLHSDKPAYTIIASGGGGTYSYHYSEPRPLTNRERARLQTFPDNFVFFGSLADVRRQIGNAVPPEGIRPVAATLREILTGNAKVKIAVLDEFIQEKSTRPFANDLSNYPGWWKAEEKWDKKRDELQKAASVLSKFGLPEWRGIEVYSPKELKTLFREEKQGFFKAAKRLITEHLKFYSDYYGMPSSLNSIMNQCEYNVHEAKNLVDKLESKKVNNIYAR